jgi:hypothetical protein
MAISFFHNSTRANRYAGRGNASWRHKKYVFDGIIDIHWSDAINNNCKNYAWKIKTSYKYECKMCRNAGRHGEAAAA